MSSPGSQSNLVGKPGQTRSFEFHLFIMPPFSAELPRTEQHRSHPGVTKVGPPVHSGPLAIPVCSGRWGAGGVLSWGGLL